MSKSYFETCAAQDGPVDIRKFNDQELFNIPVPVTFCSCPPSRGEAWVVCPDYREWSQMLTSSLTLHPALSVVCQHRNAAMQASEIRAKTHVRSRETSAVVMLRFPKPAASGQYGQDKMGVLFVGSA